MKGCPSSSLTVWNWHFHLFQVGIISISLIEFEAYSSGAELYTAGFSISMVVQLSYKH